MALINLQTNLKSLKFGGDRPGGGSSSQPYVQKSIPDQNSDPSNVFNTGGSDSLLRGGLMTPLKVADDASRLTQMFSDLKSPNGILFTTKQNLLSRTSVKTESSKGAGYAGGFLNQGAYTPLSTLGQAAVGFSGTHLNTFGLDPSSPMAGVVNGGLFPGLGLNRYEDAVRKNDEDGNNRLIDLTNTKIDKKVLNPNGPILSYSGGPGSVLGIGKTNINFASGQRTGKNNKKGITDPNYFYKGERPNGRTTENLRDNPVFGAIDYEKIDGFGGNDNTYTDELSAEGGYTWENTNAQKAYQSGSLIPSTNLTFNTTPNPVADFLFPSGSTNYGSLLNTTIENNINSDNGITWKNLDAQNVYNPGKLISNPILKNLPGWNGTTTMTQQDIESFKQEDLFPQKPQIKDFREKLAAPTTKKVLGKLNQGFYTNKNIEKRVNLGDPGKTQDVTRYGVKGKVLDKITASKIYQAVDPDHNGDRNDLVKFSIGVFQNDSNGLSSFMHFRAFINSFSDAYNAEWGNTQYVGRADKFYNYKGFDRTINMGFTVAAQSKAELIPMYKKLNFLASSLAPSYSPGGFMQGNLVRLTVGGYLFNQIGILKGLTYEIPSESPWEIGINDGFDENGNPTDDLNDASVKELPHIINVTGFSFIPIQDFVPRLSNPEDQFNTRYIQLANGSGRNKTNY